MKAETVRDQVEIKASRRLHAAASTAHERHAAGVTCRGGQRGETASGRRRRSSGRGPGRGGARARARGSGAGRFLSRAETGAAACLG
jgi:hypothetical protein